MMISLNKTLLSAAMLTMLFVTPMAMAEQVERVSYDRQLIARKASTTEEVGIAFLKTANNFPNFNKMIEASDAYKELDPLAQKDFKAKTADRLQALYLAFSPRKSDLLIRVKVNVHFNKLANGEGIMKMRTLEAEPVYFPFYFGGYPIALIIKDMEMFKNITLSKEETDIVYSRLPLSGDVTLLLQVFPLAADDTKTILLDDIPQYPLLSEIGYIGMINDQADQVWAWRNTKLIKNRTSGVGGPRSLADLMPERK